MYVCSIAYFKTTCPKSAQFCVSVTSWHRPPLTTVQYSICFRFYGWRRVFTSPTVPSFMFGRVRQVAAPVGGNEVAILDCLVCRSSNNPVWLIINSWPTFSPYLYNRVYCELTTRNPLSRSLEWTHPANNNRIRLDWRPSKREINTHYCSQTRVWTKYNYNGHELS